MTLGKLFTPVPQQCNMRRCSTARKVTAGLVECNGSVPLILWQDHLQVYCLETGIGFDHAEQTTILFASVSNNTIAISGTGCTDSRRDGQAELTSMEQNTSQNRPWLICGRRTVVDWVRQYDVSPVQLEFFCRKLIDSRLDTSMHMPGLSL